MNAEFGPLERVVGSLPQIQAVPSIKRENDRRNDSGAESRKKKSKKTIEPGIPTEVYSSQEKKKRIGQPPGNSLDISL